MTDKLSHRKAKNLVQLIQDGKPLANAQFEIDLTKHEFLFGCGAFDSISYVTAKEAEKKAFFEERIKKWLDVYNFGTLPFYWGGFEEKEGEPQTENRLQAAQFLKRKGVTLKGHPLCWHTFCAQWLLKYDNKTILKKQLERIDREVSNFKGLIDMWDVINEVVIMPIYDRYDNPVTRICKDLGQVGIVKTMFDQCIKNNPTATFLLNDFNLSPEYEDLIDRCLQEGVRIDVIGIQSHQHQGYRGREQWNEILSRFEKFNIPIHFTENTIVSGPLVPKHIEDLNDYEYKDDDSTPEFEERQKNEMKDMYTLLFEDHPLVKAITGWDFTDGAWLNAPSGVLRRDNSEKPAYTMLKDLIKKQWHTKETFKTDENGFANISGFKGEYEIRFGEKIAKYKLTETDKENKIILS